MSNIKWSCKYCTYENFPASLKCVICYQPKHSPVIEPPPVSNKELVQFNSENSTNEASHSRNFRNSELIIDCSANNTINQANALHYQDNESTAEEVKPFLKCSSCTYVNDVLRTECEACNFNLSSLEISGATASNAATTKHKVIEEKNKWACSNCTYKNWQRSIKCVMCQVPKFMEATGSGIKINTAGAMLPPNTSKDSEYSTNQHDNSENNASGKENRLPMSLSVPNIASYRPRSSSSSSGSSNTSNNDESTEKCKNNAEKTIIRTSSSSNSRNGACSGMYLQRSASKSRISPGLRKDSKNLENFDSECSRHIRSRMKNSNILFLKACIGVVENNLEAVDTYLSHGGSIARALTAEEVRILNRPSAFDVSHTLVHLAIRFRRHQIMALILQPEVTKRALKRCPTLVCPDLTDLISHEIYSSLRRRKGEFHCRYFCENVTFQLPIEITDLPSSFRDLLFEELLDQDAQKELEDDGAINWCSELSSGRLHALWNRSAGDCLLDSVLQATWGIFDKENILRRALAETLHDCSTYTVFPWSGFRH